MNKAMIVFALTMLFGCGHYAVSPLAGAARSGEIAEIRRLAKSGSDLNAGSGINNWPPIMHAVHKHQREAVKTLLELGANPHQMAGGMNAITMATSYSDTETVQLLKSTKVIATF